MLLYDYQIFQHVKRVSIRLQGDHAIFTAVHLEETIVVKTHHLSLQSILTPETHLSPTENSEKHVTVLVLTLKGYMFLSLDHK